MLSIRQSQSAAKCFLSKSLSRLLQGPVHPPCSSLSVYRLSSKRFVNNGLPKGFSTFVSHPCKNKTLI